MRDYGRMTQAPKSLPGTRKTVKVLELLLYLSMMRMTIGKTTDSLLQPTVSSTISEDKRKDN